MALASGMAGQIGYVDEVTYGTPVTVTRFVPFVSESIGQTRERLESAGIIAGRRVITSPQWNGGNVTIGGDVGHEVYTTQLGLLLKHAFGSVVTTGAGPYVHTFTPGDLAGKSMTVQVGRPDVTGVVRPFTYAGMKISSWELACAANEIATLGLTFVGKTEATATALASASYASTVGKPLKFNHASVTIAGVATPVKSITITGDNGLSPDRRFLGSQTISEPLEMQKREYSGTVDVEFSSFTLYDLFVNGTEAALVLDFTASASEKLTITMNVRVDGATPNVADSGILAQSIPFKAIASGADSTAITAVYTTTDATP